MGSNKGGLPVLGKKSTMMNLPLKKARRLDISGNADIRNVAVLKQVLKAIPNLLELNISNTGIFGLSIDTIENNKMLGHISMQGTAAACLDLELFLKLSENLARGNKHVFFA